ncbi:MAG: WD40 repeat domain-containing protein, partial [Planctomycetales bacterium]|nr:WD40 repeat domain-containing protein [Planctomycetales bacterium]
RLGCFAFSGNSQYVASLLDDDSVAVYRLSDGTTTNVHDFDERVLHLNLSDRGDRLFVVTAQANSPRVKLSMIPLAEGKETFATYSNQGNIVTSAWHPTEPVIAFGDHAQTVSWNWHKQTVRVCATEPDLIARILFHPTGLLFVNTAYTCRVWDLLAGHRLLEIPGSVIQHNLEGTQLALRQLPDLGLATFFPSACYATLPSIDARPGQSFHIHPAGQLAARATADGLHFFDLNHNRQIGSWPLENVRAVRFARDGRAFWIMIPGDSASTGLWRFSIEVVETDDRRLYAIGAPQRLCGTQFGDFFETNASGNRVGWQSAMYKFRLLDPTTNAPSQERSIVAWAGARMSPNGSWLGCQNDQATEAVIYAIDSDLQFNLPCKRAHVAFANQHDYAFVTTGLDETRLRCVDLKTGITRFSLDDRFKICTMSYPVVSPDDRILAIPLSSPPAIMLVDIATGEPLLKLSSEKSGWWLGVLQFTPDNSQLISNFGIADIARWDLRKLRDHLRQLGIDWQHPPYPAPAPQAPACEVQFDCESINSATEPMLSRPASLITQILPNLAQLGSPDDFRAWFQYWSAKIAP